jgi:hypothetical protein
MLIHMRNGDGHAPGGVKRSTDRIDALRLFHMIDTMAAPINSSRGWRDRSITLLSRCCHGVPRGDTSQIQPDDVPILKPQADPVAVRAELQCLNVFRTRDPATQIAVVFDHQQLPFMRPGGDSLRSEGR